jgi:hypothetical protein
VTPPEVAVIVHVPVFTGAVQISSQRPLGSATVCPLPEFSIAMVMSARGADDPLSVNGTPSVYTGVLSLMVSCGAGTLATGCCATAKPRDPATATINASATRLTNTAYPRTPSLLRGAWGT